MTTDKQVAALREALALICFDADHHVGGVNTNAHYAIRRESIGAARAALAGNCLRPWRKMMTDAGIAHQPAPVTAPVDAEREAAIEAWCEALVEWRRRDTDGIEQGRSLMSLKAEAVALMRTAPPAPASDRALRDLLRRVAEHDVKHDPMCAVRDVWVSGPNRGFSKGTPCDCGADAITIDIDRMLAAEGRGAAGEEAKS